MKKVVIIFLAFIFIISGCTIKSTGVKKITKKNMVISLREDIPKQFIPYDLVISSVGDSLTEGIGDSTKSGGYIPYLKTNLENNKVINKIELYNFGVKGNRTDQLLKKLQTEEVSNVVAKSNIVIVTIGGNDVMKVARENFLNLQIDQFKYAENKYKQNLHEIVRSIRSINEDVKIILVGLYNPFNTWFSDVKELDEIINNWNKTSEQTLSIYNDTYFVKVDDIFNNNGDTLLFDDNFHPNDKGYEQIAFRLTEKIINDVINDIIY